MDVNSPLSGDVNQVLRAFGLSSMNNYWSQQTGLININNMASPDPDAEQNVVEGVASYGRQLGWLLEAMLVLIEKLEAAKALPDLTYEDIYKLEQIRVLKQRIDEAMNRAPRSAAAPGNGQPRPSRPVKVGPERPR